MGTERTKCISEALRAGGMRVISAAFLCFAGCGVAATPQDHLTADGAIVDGAAAAASNEQPQSEQTTDDREPLQPQQPAEEIVVDLSAPQRIDVRDLAEPAPTGGEPKASVFGGIVGLYSGRYLDFWVSVGPNETIQASVAPPDGLSAAGDLDVELRDSSGRYIAGSARSAGYIDTVTRRNGTTSATYTVRVNCYPGATCNGSVVIARGDDTTFVSTASAIPGAYVNQRAVTATSGTCKSAAGVSLSIGECACAPSSVAMSLAAAGRIATGSALGTAGAMYPRTNYLASGQADIDRLVAEFANRGLTCRAVFSSVQTEVCRAVREGRAAVLRIDPPVAFIAGHYVQPIGCGLGTVTVNDPYGRNPYDLTTPTRNSTSSGSRLGFNITYNWSSLGGTYAVVCN